MSYHFEKNTASGKPEIVIDGFEKGIAESPYSGIGDIRNANITTLKGQASVMFATGAVTLPPTGYTAIAFSSDSVTDLFTVASTVGFYTGMAIKIVTVSGGGSALAGQVYYVGNITATTFKLYDNLLLGELLDVTTNRTGTYTVQTFGIPIDSVSIPATAYGTPSQGGTFNYTLITTTDGLVWSLLPRAITGTGGTVAINTLQFLGNVGHSSASGVSTGITIWKNYIFVFESDKIDYLSTDYILSGRPSSGWHYGWKDTNSSPQGHRALATTDDVIYFCNYSSIGSIIEAEGSTFDPATSATYIYNTEALDLPSNDFATCLAQLGTNLLVGGVQNFIYPWDRISVSFTYPLIVAESFIKCIVSTNSSAYIFAGHKGRIYITNGANVQEFLKFPDSLSGTVEPYYNWGWGIYLKNQLYFSLSATTNAGVTINNFAGIWGLDLDTNALRLTNSLSYGTYLGNVPVLVQMGTPTPTGDGIYASWFNSTGGIDYTSSSPYVNYETYIDTDIIPIGTFLTKHTFDNIEFKLGKPLVSGESIKLQYRQNLTDLFTDINSTTTAGLLSDAYPMTFQNVEWIQIRALISSTITTPSYVPLTQIRIR